MYGELSRGMHGARDAALYLLGIGTGYRVSELCSMRLGHVVDAGEIVEELTVWRRNMKGKRSSRSVPLAPEVRAVLTAYVAKLNRQGYVHRTDPLFPTDTGEPVGPRRVYDVQKAAARRLGLKGRLGTHSMRKTYGVFSHEHFMELAAQGIRVDPLLETARAMGHVSVNSTQRYLEPDQALVDEAIRAVSRQLLPPVPTGMLSEEES